MADLGWAKYHYLSLTSAIRKLGLGGMLAYTGLDELPRSDGTVDEPSLAGLKHPL